MTGTRRRSGTHEPTPRLRTVTTVRTHCHMTGPSDAADAPELPDERAEALWCRDGRLPGPQCPELKEIATCRLARHDLRFGVADRDEVSVRCRIQIPFHRREIVERPLKA